MKPELFYLTLVTAWTGILWMPYVLDRMSTRGMADALGYPQNPKPQSPWAQRLMKAHANATENLVVFAPLVLVAHAVGASGPAIVTACVIYFWARVVHTIAFTLGVPLVRTLAFAVGFSAQAVIAWQILMR